MSTEITTIQLRDRLTMEITSFPIKGIWKDGFVSFHVRDPRFTDTAAISMALSPAKAAELGAALIAAANAAMVVEVA